MYPPTFIDALYVAQMSDLRERARIAERNRIATEAGLLKPRSTGKAATSRLRAPRLRWHRSAPAQAR